MVVLLALLELLLSLNELDLLVKLMLLWRTGWSSKEDKGGDADEQRDLDVYGGLGEALVEEWVRSRAVILMVALYERYGIRKWPERGPVQGKGDGLGRGGFYGAAFEGLERGEAALASRVVLGLEGCAPPIGWRVYSFHCSKTGRNQPFTFEFASTVELNKDLQLELPTRSLSASEQPCKHQTP